MWCSRTTWTSARYSRYRVQIRPGGLARGSPCLRLSAPFDCFRRVLVRVIGLFAVRTVNSAIRRTDTLESRSKEIRRSEGLLSPHSEWRVDDSEYHNDCNGNWDDRLPK